MSILASAPPATPAPPMLPQFSHVQRFWDPQLGSWNVKILPGEYYVTRHDEVISTVLGSCISACIRDPRLNIGGMNHFMLPEDTSPGGNSWLDPVAGMATRYGSYAMESLINDLLKLGAARERLEIKVFGGSRVLAGLTDVGARNIAFIRNFVELEGYRIVAEDLGSTFPRKVIYYPTSGRVKVRRLKPVETTSVSRQEQLYLASIGKQAAGGGDVELFD
jgi:chemotaxis protein CheD